MNSKIFLQFLVCILLGYIAMARTEAENPPHTGDIVAYGAKTEVKSTVIKHVDRSKYSCNLPDKKLTRIRVRFRSASFFKTPTIQATELINSAFFLKSTMLVTGKTASIPPFYYIFLFRLTPF